MTFIARLRVIPRLYALPRLDARQRHALLSRSTTSIRSGTLAYLVWTAAASLAALIAWQVLTHPLSDLRAYGCWSVPDDASACTLGQGHGPTLPDQLRELGASVLPAYDGRVALLR